MYEFLRAIVGVLMRICTRVQIQGQNHVPPSGAFLLVTNHLSRFDLPLIFIGVRRKIVVFIARKYHKVWLLRVLAEAAGCIWVRQNEADLGAVKQALAHLRGGGVLGMSPEGTRSQSTHALIEARDGVSFFAARTGVPILPVAVWGTETIPRLLPRLRRAKVFLRIGKPFSLPAAPHTRGEELNRSTEDIMCAIAALLPPAYRGVYAGHPRLADWEARLAA
ncbi:MAG: lysophospholipid acyltransferase family protein [Chloroflexi bacterium]|nr:lysophospholipid acyltransferase family protein [Chloroflexota bacterium]